MAVTIDTTTDAIATGYGSQRSIDRCQNGNLVAVLAADVDTLEIHYSTDNGATWTATGTTLDPAYDQSVFVDLDDNLWVAYKGSGDFVNVAKYTPNTARTAWTLAGSQNAADSNRTRPTLVVFRDPAVSGGHIAVVGVQYSSGTSGAEAYPVRCSATNTFSTGSALTLCSSGAVSSDLSPCIDFHHTGDGKTVQGGTPHIYSAAAQAGSALKFRKHTYSAGTWTAGSIVDLSATVNVGRLSAIFDGSRFLIAYSPSSASTTVVVKERDAADTTTTTRTPNALSDGTVLGVSITHDVAGDVWLAAIGDTSDDVSYCHMVRATVTWNAWATTEAITTLPDTVQLRRCGQGQRIGVVYVQDTGTDAVRYADLGLANSAPLAPTWGLTAGAYDVASSLPFTWTFNDLQTPYGDTQSEFALKRVLSGGTRWWNGTDWSATSETWITSATNGLTLSTGWATHTDAARDYYVATKDTAGLAGAYSDALNVTPSAKVNPTLVTDTAETTASRTMSWTVSEQSAYQARLLSGATVVETSGWIPSTSLRAHTFATTLPNGGSYTEEITTKNAEGLVSVADDQAFTVAYVEPLAAGITLTEYTGYLSVELVNSEPTVIDIPDAVRNHLYRRVVGTTGDGIRVAVVDPNGTHPDYTVASGVDYEYMAVTDGDNGTSSSTEWVSAGSIGPEPEPEPEPAESSGLILLAR